MLISHRYKFIYFKTMKTAGSSVEVALEDLALPEGKTRKDYPVDDCVETPAGIVGCRGAKARKRKWWGHMPAALVKDMAPADVWDTYYKFCNIRNPWDKVVSFFHFHHHDAKDLPHAELQQAFRSWLATAKEFGHDTHIYSIDNSPVVDAVIRHHRIQQDLSEICGKLGIDAPELPQLKSGFRAKSMKYVDYYDAEARQKVAELYDAEIGHFNWQFDDALQA